MRRMPHTTDDAGGSGPCSLRSGEDYLLGASGWLYIADPTPGARVFTITVSAAGEEISFTAAPGRGGAAAVSRFRFYIFPRLCLALSALVLLGGLWVLWLSMGRPMPTQGLACRPGGDRPVPPPRYHLRLRPPSLRERRVVRQSRRLGGTPGRGLLYPHGVGANRWSTVAVRGHNGHHPIPLGGGDLGFPRRTGLLRRVSRGLPRQRDLV